MRVLLVNKFHWRKGGNETYYFALADGLRAAGHEVAFFSMADERNESCEWSEYFVSLKDYNGPTSAADKAKAAASLIYSIEARDRLDALCRAFEPDVMHLNLVRRQITLSILDAPWLKAHLTPVVYTSHDFILACPNYLMMDGSGNVCDACLGGHFLNCLRKKCVKGSTAKSALAFIEAERYKRRRTYSHIDRIICPSEFMRGKFLEAGFPDSQVVAMRNFVGMPSVAGEPDRERPYILYFGRLSREKGAPTLVDAFLRVAGRLPRWRLVIAGEGPEREAIEAGTVACGAGERVEFVGFKAGDELSELVCRGTRCRCSRGGVSHEGHPRARGRGQDGVPVRAGHPASLSEAILRGAATAADGEAYDAMWGRCRAFVRENCDQEEYLCELVTLYEKLDAEKRGDAT